MKRSQTPPSSGPQWWITPRWRLLALYLGFQAVVAYFLGMVLIAVTFNDDDDLLLTAGSLGFVAIFFTLQLLFIRPIRRPRLGTRVTVYESVMDWVNTDGDDVHVEQVAVARWKDGKIVHERFYYNMG